MMTMTLLLEPGLEERLKREAGRNGLPAAEYAKRAIDKHISEAEQERREKLIATLRSWNEEEIDDEYHEEELYRRLDEERAPGRKLFPPELKGISW